MSTLSKLNLNSINISDSDSEMSTFISSDTYSFPSFLIEKDLAMTSMEYLEEDSILPPYIETEDSSPSSPTYRRFNSNVFLVSNRSQSGLEINDSLINNALQYIPMIIPNKDN